MWYLLYLICSPFSLYLLHICVLITFLISVLSQWCFMFQFIISVFTFGYTMWLVGSKFPNQWLNPGPWSESAEFSLLNHQGIPWILKNILPVFIYLGPWAGCCSFSSPLSYTHLSSLFPCFLFDLLKALTFPLRMILAMIHEFFLVLCSLLFLFVDVTSANLYSIIMMDTIVVIIISSILVNFILKIKKKNSLAASDPNCSRRALISTVGSFLQWVWA